MSQPSFLQRLRSNKWVAFFTGGGVKSLDLFFNHVNPFTLQFKNKELEDHYYPFVNENSVPFVCIGFLLVALVFLIYIPLDKPFDEFLQLWISRVISAGVIFFLLICIIFVKAVRHHCMHVSTLMIFFTFLSCIISLIFRVDEEYSPLLLVILFANLHCATFVPHRAISGFVMILVHALVWIFYVKAPVVYFLLTQTLSYIQPLISLVSPPAPPSPLSIISAYTRELAHRRVYFVVHQIINSGSELKPYIQSSSGPDSYRSTKNFSSILPPGTSPAILGTNHSSMSLNVTISSSADTPRSDLSFKDPPSLKDSPSLNDTPSLKDPPSIKDSPSLKDPSLKETEFTNGETTSPNIDHVDVHTRSRASSDESVSLQSILSTIVSFFYRLWSYCLPARNEKVISEIGYHESVYSYVSKVQYRFSMYFRDEAREARFQEWFMTTNDVPLRQILLLIALMTPHDFIAHHVTSHETFILLLLRYVSIVFILILCCILTLVPSTSTWRKATVTLTQCVCSGTAFAMSMYIWYETKNINATDAEGDYSIYFGYVVRFACLGISGMGLLWLQSSLSGALMLIVMFVVTIIFNVPLAISPLIIVVVSVLISHEDEKVHRAEYFIRFHRDEVISYVRAKEQYESPATIIVSV